MIDKINPYLKEKSIVLAKSRFFLTRIITYFSLILLPVWIHKLVPLHLSFHYFITLLFLMFQMSQWYLLAKEIDYRFKVHIRTNSSMERTLYRFIVGQIIMVSYFSILKFVPQSIFNHFYWGTWVLLGLYYSWPTRGKIIQESVSTDFNEYRFLDSFEKTTFFLIILTVLISIPFVPHFDSIDVLRLYIDPQSYIHNAFWDYLYFVSYPFHKFPKLLNLSVSLYIYIVCSVLLLLSFYSILRYFFSRRICLLSSFVFLSCWAFSKALQLSILEIIFSTATICWVWACFWSLKASNYRAGLITGLVCAWATLFHPSYYFLYWFMLLFVFNITKAPLTMWFKHQVFRYTTLGGIYAFYIFITHQDHHLFKFSLNQWHQWYNMSYTTIFSKSFFALIPLGFIALIFKRKSLLNSVLWKNFSSDEKIWNISLLFLAPIFLGMFVFPPVFGIYVVLIILTSLSVIPLEQFFHLSQHKKSQRNMIFLSYLLIALLDSHMEGRVKILIGQFIKPF